MTYNPETKEIAADIEMIPKGTIGGIVDRIIEQEAEKVTEKWKAEGKANRQKNV